jgi:hypothetical protein
MSYENLNPKLMKQLLTFVFFVIISLSMSCAEQKDPNLEQATTLHNEASAIQADIEPQIEQIDSLVTVLNSNKKTLTNAATLASIDSTIAALNAVSVSFKDWEDNLIEVPGMKHSQSEGVAHHHEHKPAPEMSSEQMLAVQTEIKANIVKIKEDLSKAEEMLRRTMF